MVFSEAKAAVQPFITPSAAAEYAAEQDQMIWVEANIFGPAGINASINSTFGELLCEHVEEQLEQLV